MSHAEIISHYKIMLKDLAYLKLKLVPAGKVTTYKILAEACGVRAYRAIGQILKNNPFAPEVPCHRVVRSDGRIGGFMGKTEGAEIRKKVEILKKEGVTVKDGLVVNFERCLFRF